MSASLNSMMSAQARELMSDEERAKIVRKASEDTQKFFDNLPRKKYQDGWAEEKWEQEMEKHPLFTTKVDENEEVSPLVGAFQSLKYDPEYNNPEELAKAHKEDGNEQFKLKKYKLAVAAYTEGLNVKCEDSDLNAVLYTNRAAAYYHMGNYRKSLEDANAAKALKPNHFKAIYRGALCYLEMRRYDDCIAWCEEGLKVIAGLKLEEKEKLLLDLKKNAEEQRRKCAAVKHEKEEKQNMIDRLITAIKDRGINIEEDALTPESITFNYNGTLSKVQMTDNGELEWPVVFIYPQYSTSDFIPNFNENNSFYSYFRELFNEYPDWDTKKEYTPKNLKVFFCENNELFPVNMKRSLQNAMLDKRFVLRCAYLEFCVVSSEYCKKFRSKIIT